MSWIPLSLLHAEVSTIGIGGMSWILFSLLLHIAVSTIETVGDRGRVACRTQCGGITN